MQTNHRIHPIGRSGLMATALATVLCQSAVAETWKYVPPVVTDPGPPVVVDSGPTSYDWHDAGTWVEGTIPNAPGAVANVSTDVVGTPIYDSTGAFVRYNLLGKTIRTNTQPSTTLGQLTIGDTTPEVGDNLLVQLTIQGSLTWDNNGSGATLQTPTTSGYNAPPTFRNPLPAVSSGFEQILNDDLTIINNLGPDTDSTSSVQSIVPGLSLSGGFSETGGPRNVTYQGANGTTSIGPSSYTGTTLISEGRVIAQNATAFGTGAVTIASGAQALLFTNGDTWANDFVLSGNGWTEANGDQRGALSFGSSNTSTPGLHTVTGDLDIAADTRIEAWGNVTGALDGALTGSGNLEVNGLDTNPDLTRNGAVQINGDTSGFSGNVTVTQGRLDIGSSLNGDINVSNLASIGGGGSIGGNLNLGTASGGPPLGTSLIASSTGVLGVTGDVSLAAGTTTNIELAQFVAGSTTVLTYGGNLTGTGTFDLLGGIGNYHAGSEISTATAGEVNVNLVTLDQKWDGGNGTWTNFSDSSTWVGDEGFVPGDSATFDGTNHPGGGAPVVVTLTGEIIGDGGITVNNAAGLDYEFEQGSGSSIVSGSLMKSGAGTLTFSNTVSENTYGGGTVISGGRIAVDDSSATDGSYGPLGAGVITINGGALSSRDTSVITLANDMNLSGNVQFGDSIGSGDMNFRGNAVMSGDVTIDVAGGSGTDVRFGYYSSSSGIDSSISDGGNGFGLTKTGEGTLEIEAKSGGGDSASWTGTTTVAGGRLFIDGTLNSGAATVGSGAVLDVDSSGILNSPTLTVDTGGTLMGRGVVNADTSVSGEHAVGASAGLQSFTNSLAYTATSTFTMELIDEDPASRGSKFDAVDVTGGSFSIEEGAAMSISLGSGTGTNGVDFTEMFWESSQQWLVIDLFDTVTGDGGTETFTIASVTGGNNYDPGLGSFDTIRIADGSGKNDLYLAWTPIPEPSTLLLSVFGLGLCARRRRTA